MSTKKALTEILGIKYPILVAPMAGVSTPELAAAVSNSGGLGSLGLGASSVEKARNAIIATQKLTKSPFQVNFFCHEPEELNVEVARNWIEYLKPIFARFHTKPEKELTKIYNSFLEDPEMLAVVLELKPKVVSFHFGVPSASTLKSLKQAGVVTMASVTQLSEAELAIGHGIDILIAQGVEAGGHRGMFNASLDPAISTRDLVKLLKAKLGTTIPIVAAGGIMSGQDIKGMMEVGASGAQLGTAFVQCKESAASENYRKLLFDKTRNDITQITSSISGRPARALLNSWHTEVDIPTRVIHPGYPFTYDVGKQLNAVSIPDHDGTANSFAAHWAGSNVSRIRDMDARQLMQTLVDEMR
ncbi:putative nitronate monooxygenase [Kluyveromyces lactis]|uniref:KLLA0A03289p n=1 Tax=Kluyveromyces lactis (strain ATCC 8585 / CBS 2359 / DSM 70799 / NBRC 1267 / NRRL Y-1140 / WM37) TaxID=284590 RepID=Q6CY45_KLULA|nr:uncharacterized protein KLLA0_A03289g [Kluyveromyces lactis]CAH02732.1 KLLA0A03289p [Kluyveromyces lactis]|eukprot:XP_451144.1 uncharacterized protein KLLA0_A03289g [Kluyveromyces lactis]